MTSAFAGTRPLLRVSLKQDVRNIVPWILLISALSATSILAYAWIFPGIEERRTLAATLGANPALSLIFGPARDLLTADGFNSWRAGQLGALFAGIMAILIVVRNSRADEDSGQAELVASGVLGRWSRLTVAAVTAQLGSDARASSGLAIAFLGICFALRGYLDAGGAPDWTRWLTPPGWLELTEPATANNGWPLLVALASAVLGALAAFALQSRRDFGQGLIGPGPGPARGGVVTSVWGLALRLNRPTLVWWWIGLTALGAVFGSLASSMGDLVAHNPAMAQVFASGGAGATTLTLAFLATILQIIAIVAAIMGVQVILRIYTEETDHRVEPLLAGSLRRPVYLSSNIAVALGGTAFGMILAGVAMGLVAHTSAGVAFGSVLRQSVATIPAVWLLVAIAVAAVGAAPRIRLVGWAGVVATFALTLLGPTFRLPDWALGLSPLHHVPVVTRTSPDWGGLGVVGVVTVMLLAAGLVGYRRRDLR